MKSILIFIIKTYKYLISPYIGNNCRYLPTCSEYFIDCLNEFGVIKGCIKGIKEFQHATQLKLLVVVMVMIL